MLPMFSSSDLVYEATISLRVLLAFSVYPEMSLDELSQGLVE